MALGWKLLSLKPNAMLLIDQSQSMTLTEAPMTQEKQP
jgi:hypothetical protein